MNQGRHTVTVAGHRMAYAREGSGEPVLLVHGITTYSFIWRNVFSLLAEEFDVIAVDLLGCGESDKPLEVSYSIANHSALLREFVISLGLGKFHFIGHDLGGGMGQIFAARHPELLYDLTMVNTVAYDFWPVQPIIAMRTPVIRQFLMGSLDWGTLKLLVKRGMYHKERVTSELVELFYRPFRTREGRKAFLHFARCLDNHNLMELAEDLKKLALPVLIVRGDADAYLGASISEKLYREIPGSRLERTATAGHFIQEDEPVWTADVIRDFLKDSRG